MALGCKMHNRPRPMLREQRAHQFRIADVSAHKQIARIGLQRGQVGGIPGIGQQVKIHDRRARVLEPAQNEIRADKPGPACDKYRILRRIRALILTAFSIWYKTSGIRALGLFVCLFWHGFAPGSLAVPSKFRYIKVSAVPDAAAPAQATLSIKDLGDFAQLESRGGCVFQNKSSNLQAKRSRKGCHGYF